MYFDSSGDTSDFSLKYLTLSGFVSHESVWRSFELKWQAILDKYNISSFHMTDACSGKGLFRNWKKEKIKKLLIGLLNGCIQGASATHSLKTSFGVL